MSSITKPEQTEEVYILREPEEDMSTNVTGFEAKSVKEMVEDWDRMLNIEEGMNMNTYKEEEEGANITKRRVSVNVKRLSACFEKPEQGGKSEFEIADNSSISTLPKFKNFSELLSNGKSRLF